MDNMANVTENYQLKWHSFGNHLHSFIASAFSNDAFADVSLYTLDGHYLHAHRLVLSACSQYLHQVLKKQQNIPSTFPLLIVLPPQINHKTMKTLIQYMYSGEATVSKEILDGVLKGGELLKIRGLYHPKENRDSKIVQTNNPGLVKSSQTHKLYRPTSPPKDAPSTSSNNTDSGNTVINMKSAEQLQTVTSTVVSGGTTVEVEVEEDDEENPQFLVIKEEPIEVDEDELRIIENEIMQNEMTIKPEVVIAEQSEDAEELYSPLTCELCSEVFTVPAEWVRHIQTHTDMLPAKRQRRGRSNSDDEKASFPPLHCDMCEKFFSTPAEWVRHIQHTHTEFELRVSNKTTTTTRPVRVTRQHGSFHKICTVCNKNFPSHASMLIHKRTHTGEKPYMCEYCQKGFNVKSNLLRHLRTLHDRIISSTDVCLKDTASSSKTSVESDGGNDDEDSNK